MQDTFSQKIQNIYYVIAILIGATLILVYTKSILIPFILAGFIMLVVNPLIDFFIKEFKTPRWISVLFVAFLITLLLGLIALLITSSINSILKNIDEYKMRVTQITASSAYILEDFGYAFDSAQQEHLTNSLRILPIFNYISKTANALMGVAGEAFIVFLFVLFMIGSQAGNLQKSALFVEINNKIRIYLLAKLFASLATGLLTWLVLELLGLDMAPMFGALAFLLNFIPNIGSIIAILLPIPIAILQFTEIWRIAMAVGIPSFIQFLIGNILEPKFLGESLDLHPIAILIALMFWGMIWGITGMLLAAPILVIIKISLDKIPQAKFYSELLSGRIHVSE
ncbi:MAG: AI-2E family transporter [Oligoflexales bacterium]|nr:AI-2E family transporter [Oligoflexales bacterium]